MCQETVSQGKTFSRQGCKTDRSALKPSSWPSVKANYRETAVGHGTKVPSPDILARGLPGILQAMHPYPKILYFTYTP